MGRQEGRHDWRGKFVLLFYHRSLYTKGAYMGLARYGLLLLWNPQAYFLEVLALRSLRGQRQLNSPPLQTTDDVC